MFDPNDQRPPDPTATTGPYRSDVFDADFLVSSATSATSFDGGAFPLLPTERYQITEQVQHGGMGIIYGAQDRDLCRRVAIKILRPDRVGCPTSVLEFGGEAHIMSYLAHPGVTPIYDRGHSNDGRPFHVMKFIEGETLGDLVEKRSLSISQRLNIFGSVCETMAFAHSKNVLHLDLKPSNVMVGAFGEINVMDWGMARFGIPVDERSTTVNPITEKQRIGGTPAYMSPEQALGTGVDARTDVFGLGCVLCHLLTGLPPYGVEDLSRTFRHAAKAELGPAFERLDQCGAQPPIIRLAKNCMQPAPDHRLRSAIEVADEVTDYLDSTIDRLRNDMDRFFELSLDLFCIADFQGFYRRVNGNFTKLLGYSETELLTRPFLTYVHEDDRDRTIEQMSCLQRDEPVVRFRNRYRAAAGHFVTLEWMAKALLDEGLIFAVARDVTRGGN